MSGVDERVLLRIIIGESDQVGGKPLWEAVMARLKKDGFEGATALRGIAGFGARSVHHEVGFLKLSHDAPIIIETIDREEKIRALLPWLSTVMTNGIATLERAAVAIEPPGKKR